MNHHIVSLVSLLWSTVLYTGQYLYSLLESHPEFEIAFVWNRSKHVLVDCHVPPSIILDKLENIFEIEVDLIVEVAHPAITKQVVSKLWALT